MNISELFIRRPIATVLLTVAVVIFGIMAYFQLPVSDLPEVDYPTISVGASLPGANPYTMASAVATPLEDQFTAIEGLKSMTSTSSQGSTSITLQFDLSRNINSAAQDVQAAITAAEGALPHNMPSPPTYRKVNPAAQPVLYIGLSSRTLPLYQVDNYAENLLGNSISELSGVAQVNIFGAQTYAVRIQVNPKKLAARNIGIDALAQNIAQANVNMATGSLWGNHASYQIYSNGQLTDAAQYRHLIIAYRNGAPIRLDEVGNAINSVVNDRVAAWEIMDGVSSRAIVLAIQKQPGANTIKVVDEIRALLPKLQASIPPAVHARILFDASQQIRSGVNDVKLTLLAAMVLVVLVIFAFLRTLRATLIPSIAMPLAIIGTFAVMYELHFTIDYFSLLALTLAVGFIVDDAVVMLENSYRHIELGEAPMQATLNASREIGFTIISMTISLVAVFIPILFLSGIIGRLLNEFALTIAAAILISGFISLTLTPVLCSRFLKPPREKHNFLYRFMERIFSGSLWFYQKTLRMVLKARLVVLLLSLATLILTIYLLIHIPEGFIPAGNTGRVLVSTEGAQSISFKSMEQHQLAAAKIVAADPNVHLVMNVVGAGPIAGINNGHMFLHLKPRNERKLTTDQVIAELGPKLARIVGLRVFFFNPPPINVSGNFTKSEYQFSLQSPSTVDLFKYAPLLEKKLRTLPGLLGVNSDLQIASNQLNVIVDRSKAQALGVSAAAVEQALGYAYGSEQISTIYDTQAQYEVILELQPKYQNSPRDLHLLYVSSSNGGLVPLSAVAHLTQSLGPLSINQTGQLPSVTISFNVAPGFSLSKAVAEIQAAAKQVLPADIITNFQGAAQIFQAAVINMGVLLLVAVVVIYIVLGVLYESFIHPITILTALPFAGLGALLTLMLFGDILDLYAFVGVIMLIGLVKKNGIMMVDFAIDARRTKGLNAMESIFQACSIRFRPIMMTTMAALLGTMPIVLGSGAGSGTRRPLGLAVVGGLLFSQLLTLYVTPVFYVYLDKIEQIFSGKKGGKQDANSNGQANPATVSVPALQAAAMEE